MKAVPTLYKETLRWQAVGHARAARHSGPLPTPGGRAGDPAATVRRNDGPALLWYGVADVQPAAAASSLPLPDPYQPLYARPPPLLTSAGPTPQRRFPDPHH